MICTMGNSLRRALSEVTGWSWVELEEEGGVGGVAACSNGRQHWVKNWFTWPL